MKQKLLNYIVCPKCFHEFQLNILKLEDDEIISGELLCKNCAESYPIIEGIPRIFSKEIKKKEAKTSKSFGHQWLLFPEFEKSKEYEFESYTQPHMNKHFYKGKIILDAGCGMGHSASVVASYGAKEVIAVDFSNGIHVAYERFKDINNIHFIQCDIHELPFKNIFDLIYSIGVLHHLPDPSKGFLRLVNKHLKGNGYIFVWLYAKEGNWIYITFFDSIRKNITSKLPIKINVIGSAVLSAFLWVITNAIYKPLNRVKLNKILPMNNYFIFFADLGFRRLWVNVLDKMIPPYQFYYSKENIENLFKKGNLKNVEISFRNGNSWRGFGKKI